METFKSENYEYVVFTDNKDVEDMKSVFTSHCRDFNYVKVAELTHDGDTILIGARKIKIEE